MKTLIDVLLWADSHGLAVPFILAAVTGSVRLFWALLRPVVARRLPAAVPLVEDLGERAAALLPDLVRALWPRSSAPPRTSPPADSDGQRGAVSAGALVVAALLAALAVCLWGCPRLPPQSGCDLGAQRCASDHPEVCSASGRWHRVGDLACASVGGSCLTSGGRAFCGTAEAAPGDVGLAHDGGAR